MQKCFFLRKLKDLKGLKGKWEPWKNFMRFQKYKYFHTSKNIVSKMKPMKCKQTNENKDTFCTMKSDL